MRVVVLSRICDKRHILMVSEQWTSECTVLQSVPCSIDILRKGSMQVEGCVIVHTAWQGITRSVPVQQKFSPLLLLHQLVEMESPRKQFSVDHRAGGPSDMETKVPKLRT